MGTAPEKVLSDEWLARTDKAFDTHKELRDLYAPGRPVWLTETAEAACGGDPWAATFADSFRYVDQLARLAKRGVSAVFHNTLAASEYGLIDQTTLEPRPNYWVALLWRNLMGSVVLDTAATRPDIHVYAHCLRDHTGGVALLVLNLSDASAVLAINGARGSSYALTADSLQSQGVLLNGRALTMAANGTLPELKGKRMASGRADVAPRSIEFISVPDARNASCQQNRSER
jgi:hypothetical protein